MDVGEYGGEFKITNLYPGIITEPNFRPDQSSYDFGLLTNYYLFAKPTNPIPEIAMIRIKYPVTI
jgi:hypothetical protein